MDMKAASQGRECRGGDRGVGPVTPAPRWGRHPHRRRRADPGPRRGEPPRRGRRPGRGSGRRGDGSPGCRRPAGPAPRASGRGAG
ncbi:MAG: hypothetical protein D6798_02330 [Deltaproteobacteria bacterium]|nr:MAG: hypothetical protein D6798_02330 [Deltaproteobacteria bacterium]